MTIYFPLQQYPKLFQDFSHLYDSVLITDNKKYSSRHKTTILHIHRLKHWQVTSNIGKYKLENADMHSKLNIRSMIVTLIYQFSNKNDIGISNPLIRLNLQNNPIQSQNA